MIKMSFEQLINAAAAITKLRSIKPSSLPEDTGQKTAYQIKRLTDKARKLLQRFEGQRDELVRELGEEREPTTAEGRVNGGRLVLSVKKENLKTFDAQLKQILEIEETIDLFPVKIKDLGRNHDLTIDDLSSLGDLIEWEES